MIDAAEPGRSGRFRDDNSNAAMKPSQCIRILVAESDLLLRVGVSSLLRGHPDMTVVGEASDGAETVDGFRRHSPDVILLGADILGKDGLNAIAVIQDKSPNARFIVLTHGGWDENAYRALKAGVRACIPKGIALQEFLMTIRAVHSGQRCIPPDVAAKLVERVSSRDLTSRELTILPLLAAGKRNKQIGAALSISTGTVKVHVAHILSKLQASDRTQAVTTALKRGLIQLP